jgi:hypothetical protein
MAKITLIGTSFTEKGQGVPEMVENYFNAIKGELDVGMIDITEIATTRFQSIPILFSRDLALLSLRDKLSEKNLHVMHPFDLIFNVMPLLNISKRVKKKVVTVHDFFPFINSSRKGLKKSTYEHLKRRGYDYLTGYDFILATSRETREQLINRFDLDDRIIEVQGPVIDYNFRPRENEREKEVLQIGYINNFNWNKVEMLRHFIEKFKQNKRLKAKFHIYGPNFPFSKLIEDDIRITYHGYLPHNDVPKTLSKIDVYLSTSAHEGFGIPIAKAKAMKVPVLCYDGVIPDIMKRNTLIWNKTNLDEILDSRAWERVNLDDAYRDISSLRPQAVIDQSVRIYEDVFQI